MFRDTFDDNKSKLMLDYDLYPHPDFEGLSPFQMHHLLNNTFGENSPLSLEKMDDADYLSIPIFQSIHHLLSIIVEQGELKLTTKGYLPIKVVGIICENSLVKDEFLKYRSSLKFLKESDSMIISTSRIIAEIAGLIKKRYNKLSLTEKGKKIYQNNHSLLVAILSAFTNKFNWAYYDGYGDNFIAQMGYGFSIYLMSKYGDEKRLADFYAEKYFKAYPKLILSQAPSYYKSLMDYSIDCYNVRTFDRFLYYLGVVTISSDKEWGSKQYVIKKDLFDNLFQVKM